MQEPLPFMLPPSDWSPPSVSSLPSWKGAKRIAIDLETKDPQLTTLGPGVRRDGRIIGVAFAIEDGPAHYLPIAHENGGNLDPKHVLEYLQDQAKVFDGVLVGANLSYEIDYLLEYGIEFRPKWWRDVQVAEPLLDELQMRYGLDAIAERYQLPGKDEDLLRAAAEAYDAHPKKELYKIPAKYVGPYAIQDVRLPLQLIRRQERRIDEENLGGIYDLESKVLPITVAMRRRGVRVDLDRLQGIEDWAIQEEQTAAQVIYEETGVRLGLDDINQDDYVIAALEKSGVQLTERTEKGKISTAASVLGSIDNKVAPAILRARKFNKLRGTFVNGVRKHLIGDRIHTTFNQLKSSDDSGAGFGTVSGRFSSTDPNLQNQPARDPEIGSRWRSIYVPDEGKKWAKLDYSQQEPRMAVHYAALLGLPGAREAAQVYHDNPDTDNHTLMAQIVLGLPPDKAPSKHDRTVYGKTIFLGILYAMGGAKLCNGLGLPTKYRQLKNGEWYLAAGDEGQVILDRFDSAVPWAKKLRYAVERRAKSKGYVVTILGRRCRFPFDDTGRNFDWTHKALNRLIQGGCADQTKLALVQCEEAGHEIQLQVHDELDTSVEEDSQALEMSEIMSTCVPMKIPSKVDAEVGPNWGEVELVKR